jgi:hypothetical protein
MDTVFDNEIKVMIIKKDVQDFILCCISRKEVRITIIIIFLLLFCYNRYICRQNTFGHK